MSVDDPPTFADAYREHPEGFASLAEKAEGELRERMMAVIKAENSS